MCYILVPQLADIAVCPCLLARSVHPVAVEGSGRAASIVGSSGNRVGSWKDLGGSEGSPLLCKEGVGR
jgi:hypothetical protein